MEGKNVVDDDHLSTSISLSFVCLATIGIGGIWNEEGGHLQNLIYFNYVTRLSLTRVSLSPPIQLFVFLYQYRHGLYLFSLLFVRRHLRMFEIIIKKANTANRKWKRDERSVRWWSWGRGHKHITHNFHFFGKMIFYLSHSIPHIFFDLFHFIDRSLSYLCHCH